jgi:hypothetical protein
VSSANRSTRPKKSTSVEQDEFKQQEHMEVFSTYKFFFSSLETRVDRDCKYLSAPLTTSRQDSDGVSLDTAISPAGMEIKGRHIITIKIKTTLGKGLGYQHQLLISRIICHPLMPCMYIPNPIRSNALPACDRSL